MTAILYPGSIGRAAWPLEKRLTRCWGPDTFPDAELLLAVMTLAAVPHALAVRLAAHLTGGICLGYGSVPDLPRFESLRSLRLPVQDASWDLTPGVYDPNARRIGIGTVPSTSVSVCGHELGHACDHMDGYPSREEFWQHLQDSCRDRLMRPYRIMLAERPWSRLLNQPGSRPGTAGSCLSAGCPVKP
ncbi:hypothetical protein [Microbispora rosea]|uniref:hypothetical protein n=1 Tax=Microbispora rosea TaxID=58117 RepID=UPI003D8D9121